MPAHAQLPKMHSFLNLSRARREMKDDGNPRPCHVMSGVRREETKAPSYETSILLSFFLWLVELAFSQLPPQRCDGWKKTSMMTLQKGYLCRWMIDDWFDWGKFVEQVRSAILQLLSVVECSWRLVYEDQRQTILLPFPISPGFQLKMRMSAPVRTISGLWGWSNIILVWNESSWLNLVMTHCLIRSHRGEGKRGYSAKQHRSFIFLWHITDYRINPEGKEIHNQILTRARSETDRKKGKGIRDDT